MPQRSPSAPRTPTAEQVGGTAGRELADTAGRAFTEALGIGLTAAAAVALAGALLVAAAPAEWPRARESRTSSDGSRPAGHFLTPHGSTPILNEGRSHDHE